MSKTFDLVQGWKKCLGDFFYVRLWTGLFEMWGQYGLLHLVFVLFFYGFSYLLYNNVNPDQTPQSDLGIHVLDQIFR